MIHNGLKYFLTHSQSTNSSNVFTSLPVEKEIITNHNKYSLKNFADSEFKIGETHLINSLNVFIRLPFEMIKTPKLNLTCIDFSWLSHGTLFKRETESQNDLF